MSERIDVTALRRLVSSRPDMGGYFEVPEQFRDLLDDALRVYQAVADAPEGEIFAGEHDRFVGVNVAATLNEWMCAHHGTSVRLVPTSGEGDK